jgi:hypothetical protein
MFSGTNDQARRNLDKTRQLEGKADALSSFGEEFHKRARAKVLSQQSWKDYIRNLKESSEKYNETESKEGLETYEERLKEACDYLQAKLEDKKKVFNPKELKKRKSELKVHQERIKAAYTAHLKKFSFLDDESLITPSPTKNDLSSSSLLVSRSPSRSPSSPSREEITYTSSLTTLDLSKSSVEEADGFSLSNYCKSFFSCCNPKPPEHKPLTKTHTSPTKRS